jgi:hypothetical protein
VDILTAKNVIETSEDNIKQVLLREIYNLESFLRYGPITTPEEKTDMIKRLKRVARMYNEMFTPP